MVRIPLEDIENQELEIILGGQSCRIVVTWLPRAAGWYLSLWVGNRMVASGRQMVTKALLLREAGRSAGFLGDLWVSPAEGTKPPPLHAWAQGWGLYYLTETEASLGDFA